jgi:hypothetical protein
VVAHPLVPELVLVSSAHAERLLPDAADGSVEVYAGNDGFEAYGYAGGGHYWAHLPGTASFRFLADESSVVAISDTGASPGLVEDAYFRNVLPLVMQLRGYEVLHASAVSTPGGLVVLCGVSGAGKSTFASAMSARGHRVWADDAVVLKIDSDDAVALQVPFRLGLRSDAAAFLPPNLDDRDGAGEAPSRSQVIALIVLGPVDRPNGPLVDVRRLAPTDAFTALLPHAYYFRLSDPARNALMLDRYLRLASWVPTFDVRYRPGLGHFSAMLDEIEKRVMLA